MHYVTTDINRPVIKKKPLCHLAGTLIALLRREIIYYIYSINLYYVHINAYKVFIFKPDANLSLKARGGCYMEVWQQQGWYEEEKVW